MTREQAIKTVTKWWSDKLRSWAKPDDGDNSFFSMLCRAYALADGLPKPITDEQLSVFETELSKMLEVETSNGGPIVLRVDCHPCFMLCNAAKASGISERNFPYNTSVVMFNRDWNYRIMVSDGYDKPYETLSPVD